MLQGTRLLIAQILLIKQHRQGFSISPITKANKKHNSKDKYVTRYRPLAPSSECRKAQANNIKKKIVHQFLTSLKQKKISKNIYVLKDGKKITKVCVELFT